jgi:hypothetical protein
MLPMPRHFLHHLHANPDASLHDLAQLTFQSDQAFGTLAGRMKSRTAQTGRPASDLCGEPSGPTGPGTRHQEGQFNGRSDPNDNASDSFTVSWTSVG